MPADLKKYDIAVRNDGNQLVYTFDVAESHTGIAALLGDLSQAGIKFKDLNTEQSSLEDIFVTLVRESA